MTKTGECAIRMRISVNGTRIDSNTGKYIDPTLWNQSKERAKGTSKNAIDLNDYIDETNIKLFKLFQDMQSEGEIERSTVWFIVLLFGGFRNSPYFCRKVYYVRLWN